MTTQILNQAKLKARFDYNPDTGAFTRRMANNRTKPAGALNHHGYVAFYIGNRRYLAHVLAWLYVHGEMPVLEIDHINRDKADNRIANLREATLKENLQNRGKNTNNTSGHLGVGWNKAYERWYARIMVDRKSYHLGHFEHLADAVAARKAAELLHHPFSTA